MLPAEPAARHARAESSHSARVAAIGPGFSQFAAAIEELACDGAFLASLSPAELDETFEDIGVTARLQRRRVMFALGLGK